MPPKANITRDMIIDEQSGYAVENRKEREEMNKPNKEIVLRFLKKDNPASYDFKLESACLQIDDDLERFLFFKRKGVKAQDPDQCELTMSIMCYLLEMQGYNVMGYEGRHIWLDDDIVLETDTANSFISLYKGALMQHIPNYFELCDELEIRGSFMDHYETIFNNRNRFTLEKYDDALNEEFKDFAKLTHTIGNFILGPKGFNCADKRAKSKINGNKWNAFDRVDLFLHKVGGGFTHDHWEAWFSKNIFTTYLNFFYQDIYYDDNGSVDLKRSKCFDLGNKDWICRIKTLNRIILIRGNVMVSDLKKYLV